MFRMLHYSISNFKLLTLFGEKTKTFHLPNWFSDVHKPAVLCDQRVPHSCFVCASVVFQVNHSQIALNLYSLITMWNGFLKPHAVVTVTCDLGIEWLVRTPGRLLASLIPLVHLRRLVDSCGQEPITGPFVWLCLRLAQARRWGEMSECPPTCPVGTVGTVGAIMQSIFWGGKTWKACHHYFPAVVSLRVNRSLSDADLMLFQLPCLKVCDEWFTVTLCKHFTVK